VRLFISVEQKQFSRPATGVFPVKSDAQDGGRMFFYSYFRRLQKAAENMGFFFPTNRTGWSFFVDVFARIRKPAKT